MQFPSYSCVELLSRSPQLTSHNDFSTFSQLIKCQPWVVSEIGSQKLKLVPLTWTWFPPDPSRDKETWQLSCFHCNGFLPQLLKWKMVRSILSLWFFYLSLRFEPWNILQGVESVGADMSENFESIVQQWKSIFNFFPRRGDAWYLKCFTKNRGINYKWSVPVLHTILVISVPGT